VTLGYHMRLLVTNWKLHY